MIFWCPKCDAGAQNPIHGHKRCPACQMLSPGVTVNTMCSCLGGRASRAATSTGLASPGSS
jgi:hypothetical protein